MTEKGLPGRGNSKSQSPINIAGTEQAWGRQVIGGGVEWNEGAERKKGPDHKLFPVKWEASGTLAQDNM